MGMPDERQQMMFTHRVEGDVPHDDHFFIMVFMELLPQVSGRIILHATKYFLTGTRHTLGRALQAGAVWIVPYGT
jgi:hypothetical protein